MLLNLFVLGKVCYVLSVPNSFMLFRKQKFVEGPCIKYHIVGFVTKFREKSVKVRLFHERSLLKSYKKAKICHVVV